MEDFIKVNKSPNRSTIDALVIPSSDGTFVIDLISKATWNGHETPKIWNEIQIDGQVMEQSQHVPWKDGEGSIEITTAFQIAKGKICKVRGASGNENADSTSVEMSIRRFV